MNSPDITIVGGGLAGAEASWQLAQRGLHVTVYEMRPNLTTGAHQTANLAELVCSNSLGSDIPDRASGLLKTELKHLGSLLLDCAYKAALPAGTALAVDREVFSLLVSERIASHPNICIVREEITNIPTGPAVIASGPLTSDKLAAEIVALTGEQQLCFFDAIAPIVSADSIDMNIAFHGSRYGNGMNDGGDYINCPFSKEQYLSFVDTLKSAERIPLRKFEIKIEQGVDAGMDRFFEGCLPAEIIAQRSSRALAFGPMRPTGLSDPHTGRWPYALLQLRQDNLAASLYNMVGFQTNLTYTEQKRVFHLVPGLEGAEFVRYGQMHRNTFLASPNLLNSSLQYRNRSDLFFAGQITGVEGYVGNIATGLLAGMNLAILLQGGKPLVFPKTTMLGALCHYITHANLKDFQPMKANFGILPPLSTTERMDKRTRAGLLVERAHQDFEVFLKANQLA